MQLTGVIEKDRPFYNQKFSKIAVFVYGTMLTFSMFPRSMLPTTLPSPSFSFVLECQHQSQSQESSSSQVFNFNQAEETPFLLTLQPKANLIPKILKHFATVAKLV